MDFSDHWVGWYMFEGFLCDPAGNKYMPLDIVQTFYGRQLYREQVGTPGIVCSLKRELQDRIENAGKLVVEVRLEYPHAEDSVLQTIRVNR